MQTELRFQVANDEEQQKIDGNAFPAFNSRKKKNLAFLKEFYPELFKQVVGRKFGEHSIFINRQGKLNIVELSTGEALYPLDSDNVQRTHARQASKTTYTPGKRITSLGDTLMEAGGIVFGEGIQPNPGSSDTLICLGLGGGLAIDELAFKTSYKSIIVLEPNWDYFLASLFSVDWLEVNRTLNNRGGMLAFDIEEASSVAASVNEIFSQLSLSQADVYVHLHYPEYDAFIQAASHGYKGAELIDAVAKMDQEYNKHYHESPLFSHAVATEFASGTGTRGDIEKLKHTFQRNLTAFESFFPDIANAMKHYAPQHWQLTVNQTGDCNLFNRDRKTFWYNSPVSEDIEASLERFQESPVETVPHSRVQGGKLSHYTFYQYSQKIAEVMDRFGKTRTTAPKEIPSLIFISLGLGRVQEQLLMNYNVEYLYVIEPNLDFFFWSLHCIDWSEILDTFAASSKHLSFSLGDDGSHFIDDMRASMGQFNGFFLFNSFLFMERRQRTLAPYVVEFRENLMNLLSLSEHFHYAHYTLSHTYKNFSSGHTSVNVRSLDYDSMSTDKTVFVVGNGPSLDKDMAYLKAVQDKVVIVSCGTVLRSLWKNGITPDFHAEVEQNKCTYSIISQIPDSSYLKAINYLAPTSTHPETASLFKHHYAMLTSLTGSLQFFNRLQERVAVEPVLPVLPSPTVTNFAVSSLLGLGIKNIVLLGVDLGFKDVSHHHSKDSLYYKDGKEQTVPTYEETMGGKLMVRGNFEPFVYTKPEFKRSAKNLGESILASDNVLVQNCSDGARIEGALPVKSSDIELPQGLSKSEFLHSVLTESFSLELTRELFSELDRLYQSEQIDEKFHSVMSYFDNIDGSFRSIKSAIEAQKSILLQAYHEGYPLFYGLFVSTFNFAHSSLLKVALSQKDETAQVEIVKEVRDLLVEMLNRCFKEYQDAPLKLEETVDTELVAP